MTASYVALHHSGELAPRAEAALARLAACDLCPQDCGVDRLNDPPGAVAAGAVCRTGRRARVASVGPAFTEESALTGPAGSGDIVFSWCNLRCVYCANWESSLQGAGEDMDAAALAEAMLSLQARGCPAINLVGPTHVVAQILEALVIAADRGLNVPLIYNSGGYDAVETLRLLDGVVDLYTPDIKYADDQAARRCSKVRDHGAINRAALAEMARQVGPLWLDQTGLARRGLLVRHLVLPGDIGGAVRAVETVRAVCGEGTAMHLLTDYRPAHRADSVPELRAPVPEPVIKAARARARDLGLRVISG